MYKKPLIIMVLPLIVLGAEWQALDGPLTGLADDMSIGWHEGIQGWVIYAADATHKLYKSINEGEYWDSILDPYIVNPTCVITRPNNAQIVYIGKNNDVPVWWSTDGGQTWDERSGEYPNNITNNNPLCFAMDPNNPDTVYTGFDYQDGDDCLYKTTNGGSDWTGCSVTRSIRDIWIHPDNAQILYIATADSIRKSNDCGASWTKLPAPSSDGYDTYCIAVNTDQTPEVLFTIIMDLQDFKAKIYKTTDDGQNWTLLYTFPDSPVYDMDLMPTGLEINASTSGQNIYATIRPLGFYKSTNYGANWSASNTGIGDKHLYSLMQHPSTAECLFAGGCMAVYKSTDYGATWSEITKGMRLTEVVKITERNGTIWSGAYCPDYEILYNAAPISGLVKSTNGGSDWTITHHANLHYVRDVEIAPSNSNIVFASYQQEADMSYIFRTTDCGSNWDLKYFQGDYDIKDLTISNSTPDSVRACGHQFPPVWHYPKVWRTSNCGDDWVSYQFPFIGRFYTIATDPTVSYTIYTVGRTLPTEVARGFERSTDGGQNWGPVGSGCKRPIYEIAIDPFSTEIVYAAGDSGIFKSTDGAVSFEGKSVGLSDSLTIDLVIDPEEPAIIYALVQSDATSITNSLYCSVDGSAKWFQFTLPPGNNPPEYVFDIGMDNVNLDKLFAGTEKGAYVFYPQYINKHLTSSSNEATKSNASRKMLRGGIDDFWITYESGGVIFAVHSTDGGRIWSKKMEIGYGCNPGISTDPNAETPKPGIVWRSQNHDILYFARHISGTNWTSPIVLQTSVNGFGPPSFVIGTDNFGRVVYSEFDGQSDKIYLYKFHIYFPFPGIPALIDEGIDPSIDFMLSDGINPEIHVTWVKSNGVWYSSKLISGTSWLNKQRIIPFGVQPCIEVCGANVYVVCKRHKTISHRWASYFNGNPTWSGISVPNFSQTATHSVYPVLTGGWSCAWTEQESDSDIYFSYYDPALGWVDPINISNTTESSAHAHIVHKQTVNQTTIYFIWVEKDNAPYHIEFVSEIFGDRDKGEDYDLPFYIADGGEQDASPFNLRRQGYLQYGPEPYKRIDYDGQYLEYQFANLNPDREYGAGVYLYQHNSANLAISAEVDGYQIGALNLPPDTLIILRHMIPAAFYADSMIHVKIYGNNAVSAILVLYEYEIESDRGGPQSSQSLPGQAGVLALSIVPNPVKENVGVRYTLPTATSVKLSLFDVTGRLIEHVVNENHSSGTYHKSFSNINLSQGVYFVRLESDDQALVKKVIFLK